MREATSVNKGWVVVGLILLVSGLAGFQAINSPAYAQLLENGTVDSSQDNLPSNLLQNQLSPDQNSLIATPGPTSDELSPPQQEPSVIGGEVGEQQTPIPNSETLLETTADEQNQDAGETIGNSIVQNPVPGSEQLENSQPGVSEQNNQPRTDDDTDNSAREGQQGNQEAEEATDGGDEEDEEDEEDAIDSSKEEIPSSLRNWLPFP